MFKGRSLELSVQYAPGGESSAAESAGTAGTESVAATLTPGTAIELNAASIYVSSMATTVAGRKSGIYYIYDGLLIRGRYRITNTPTRCGKTPVGKNVTGWLPAEYCAGAAGTNATGTAGGNEPPAAVDITGFVESLTYEDNATDSSDSVDITLNAQDERWLGEWLPRKGARLYPKALGHDWDEPGDERVMECGVFTVDDINISDTPTTLSLGGVSKPSDSGFSEQERETVWQNTSVKRIGETIAARYGLAFAFDGEDHTVVEDEQDGTDSAYYNTLCKKYGLVLKVYAGRLWVYDREKYKAKAPARTIDRGQMLRGSVSWTTTLAGTYTGGTIEYTDPHTDQDITYSIGSGTRIKALNQKASSVQDAAAQLCAALNEANHGATTLKFSLPGAWGLSAGQTVTVTGFGTGSTGSDGINGKYFVDRVTQKFSRGEGMTTAVECSRVEIGFPDCVNSGGDGADGGGLAAGTAVRLDNAPIYVSSDAQTPAGHKSGVYYLYDGLLIRGRYRITNTPARCGMLPVGKNVTGWVAAEDLSILSIGG